MPLFKDKGEYKEWIESEEWYQTMHLPSGLTTHGKVATDLREPVFNAIDFKGKSFLDVGCNSGHYCFLAKERGAGTVMGIDINTKRLGQARIIAENEGYDIAFEERSIFDTNSLPQFDIVFCIAVLTEIQDLFGAVDNLKRLIGDYALVELDLAKPIVYASYSKKWLKGYPTLSRRTAVTEVRQSNGGMWVISPSLDVLRNVFGSEFKLARKEGGVRYDLVEVRRVAH